MGPETQPRTCMGTDPHIKRLHWNRVRSGSNAANAPGCYLAIVRFKYTSEQLQANVGAFAATRWH